MKLIDLKVGYKVVTDKGFTCMPAGIHTVCEDSGGLFIPCAEGHHYLVGQMNAHGELVGISPVRP